MMAKAIKFLSLTFDLFVEKFKGGGGCGGGGGGGEEDGGGRGEGEGGNISPPPPHPSCRFFQFNYLSRVNFMLLPTE